MTSLSVSARQPLAETRLAAYRFRRQQVPAEAKRYSPA
jgi:hypothetical protein